MNLSRPALPARKDLLCRRARRHPGQHLFLAGEIEGAAAQEFLHLGALGGVDAGIERRGWLHRRKQLSARSFSRIALALCGQCGLPEPGDPLLAALQRTMAKMLSAITGRVSPHAQGESASTASTAQILVFVYWRMTWQGCSNPYPRPNYYYFCCPRAVGNELHNTMASGAVPSSALPIWCWLAGAFRHLKPELRPERLKRRNAGRVCRENHFMTMKTAIFSCG